MRRVTLDADRPRVNGAIGQAVVAVVAQPIEHVATDLADTGVVSTRLDLLPQFTSSRLAADIGEDRDLEQE